MNKNPDRSWQLQFWHLGTQPQHNNHSNCHLPRQCVDPRSLKRALLILKHSFLSKKLLPLLTLVGWLAFPLSSYAQSSVSPNFGEGTPTLPSSQSPPRLLVRGTQIAVNNRIFPAAWSQWEQPTTGRTTAISDAGLMQLGVELLNTKDVSKQPVQWFSQPSPPLELDSWHHQGYRYLDVTQLAATAKWQMQATGNTLRITTPVAQVKAIRQGKQAWGDRIVIDLDRPTFWVATPQPSTPKPKPSSEDDNQPPNQEWLITLDATAEAAALTQIPDSTLAAPTTSILKLDAAATTIRLSVPAGLSPRLSTLANPHRLVIDLRSDPMVERDIQWASGLRWRQQFITVGEARFPVVWLEVNPRTVGLSLKPIASQTNTLVGIAPMLATAQRFQASAAINGGFFNRKNQLPLGAIRRDGQWLSGPILNRGAIAWNDSGQFDIGRLQLQESIITASGQRLPLVTFNSGYVKSGIARYTSAWGATYTPLIDNEIVVIVQNNQVTAQIPAKVTNQIPIPVNGYLLALRANPATATFLPVGTLVRTETTTNPASFGSYPHILGGGPLLLHNRQIVLNAQAEGFSEAFARQTAARSAIGTTATGNLLIAAVHNRAGGVGPSLSEIAKIMQQLGCTNALNLDGGSSTSLYLGGQLLDRSPRTAARVHNGLGIFLEPR